MSDNSTSLIRRACGRFAADEVAQLQNTQATENRSGNTANDKWAMTDSNRRHPPCKGEGDEIEGQSPQQVTTGGLSVCTRVCTSDGQSGATDPDLVAIGEAWPTLPMPVKAGILAMVKAAGGQSE